VVKENFGFYLRFPSYIFLFNFFSYLGLSLTPSPLKVANESISHFEYFLISNLKRQIARTPAMRILDIKKVLTPV